MKEEKDRGEVVLYQPNDTIRLKTIGLELVNITLAIAEVKRDKKHYLIKDS